MIWTNVALIFIQSRHREWVKCIHRFNISSIALPEFRVTQSTFVLVTTSVLYTISSSFYVDVALFNIPR